MWPLLEVELPIRGGPEVRQPLWPLDAWHVYSKLAPGISSELQSVTGISCTVLKLRGKCLPIAMREILPVYRESICNCWLRASGQTSTDARYAKHDLVRLSETQLVVRIKTVVIIIRR